jgi:ABC-type uncharacterized transport system auxiliary subunit
MMRPPPRTLILRLTLLLPLLALLSCASTKPLPEEHFYRLSAMAPKQKLPAAPVSGVLVVEPLTTVSLYAERSIVYSDDPEHLALQNYNYQHWSDSPPRMLQTILQDYLRAANVAEAVTTEVGRARPAGRVSGHVLRFEQLRDADAWQVVVALDLRADLRDSLVPLVAKRYESTQPVAGGDMKATVQAFSAATEDILRRFLDDLTKSLANPPAPASK